MEIALTIIDVVLKAIGIVLGVFLVMACAGWFYDSIEQIKRSLRNIDDSLHQFGDRTKAKDEKPVISVEY